MVIVRKRMVKICIHVILKNKLKELQNLCISTGQLFTPFVDWKSSTITSKYKETFRIWNAKLSFKNNYAMGTNIKMLFDELNILGEGQNIESSETLRDIANRSSSSNELENFRKNKINVWSWDPQKSYRKGTEIVLSVDSIGIKKDHNLPDIVYYTTDRDIYNKTDFAKIFPKQKYNKYYIKETSLSLSKSPDRTIDIAILLREQLLQVQPQ